MLIRFLGTKFLNPEARVGETTYPMTRNKRGHWLINVEDPKDSGLFLAMSETWRQYNEAEEVARDEEARRAREAEAEADDDDDDGAGEGDRDTIETLRAQQAKLDEAAAAQVAKDKVRKAAARAKKETGAKGVRVPATKKATDTSKADAKTDGKDDTKGDGAKGDGEAKGLGIRFAPPSDAEKTE